MWNAEFAELRKYHKKATIWWLFLFKPLQRSLYYITTNANKKTPHKRGAGYFINIKLPFYNKIYHFVWNKYCFDNLRIG